VAGWFRDPDLADGERLLFRRAASVRQGRRWVGGEVVLTEGRLYFTPNVLEHRTGGRAVVVERALITGAEVTKPGPRWRPSGILGYLQPQVEIRSPEDTVVLSIAEPDPLIRALAG